MGQQAVEREASRAEEHAPAVQDLCGLYNLAYVSWIDQQVALLRAGRLSDIDADSVAEELSDLGKAQFYRLQGSLTILIMHMLKWDQQAEHRSASWAGTIREHRRRITRLVDTNPGLEPRLPEALADGYEDARGWASIETGIPDDEFPAQGPYTWDDIIGRPFEVDERARRKR